MFAAGTRDFSEVFDEIVAELLHSGGLRWPAPDDVRLFPLVLPNTHPHAAVFNSARVPKLPGDDDTPYFLFDGLVTAGDHVSVKLLSANEKNPLVIFAASGSGKTRALMQLLWCHHGTFLVVKPRTGYSKNFGSHDLAQLVAMLESSMTKFSAGDKRDYAAFCLQCVLRIRLAVKEAWEASVGKPVSPAQWLLVQLHPERFFGRDVFEAALEPIVRSCTRASVVTLYGTPYLTVVDEAQVLLRSLSGVIPSRQVAIPGEKVPVRSLLSCLLDATGSFGSNLIMAGTGLSMRDALTSVESEAANRSSDPIEGVFSDFPIFTEDKVRAFLARVLQPPQAKGSLDNICAWLRGRPRFAIKFVEHRVARTDNPVDMGLAAFLELMTTNKEEPKSVAQLLNNMVHDPRLGPAPYSMNQLVPIASQTNVSVPGTVEISSAFEVFKWAAWNEVNGKPGFIQRHNSLALVEAGLALVPPGLEQTVALDLEPLVRETMRVAYFSNSVQLEEGMLRGKSEASSLGFMFERSVPVAVIPALFKNPPERFENNTLFNALELPKAFHGYWRPCLAHHGRIVERGGGLLNWFNKAYELDADDKRGLPAGLYPANEAGPDFVCLVERIQMDEKRKWIATTPRALVLVLVQTKLAKSVTAATAALTVDPNLLYHKKRNSTDPEWNGGEGGNSEHHRKFLSNLRRTPVLRVVVSAAEDVVDSRTPLVQVIDHGRAESTFPQDLLITVRGETHVKAFFKNEFAQFLKELKMLSVEELEEVI